MRQLALEAEHNNNHTAFKDRYDSKSVLGKSSNYKNKKTSEFSLNVKKFTSLTANGNNDLKGKESPRVRRKKAKKKMLEDGALQVDQRDSTLMNQV